MAEHPNLPVLWEINREGIGQIIFRDPNSRVNTFTPEALIGFKEGIQSLDQNSSLRGVVISSSLENIFIAGADLHWLERLNSEKEAYDFAVEGRKILDTVANFRVPVIAAIHGACAGGGCELVQACHYRIATDDPQTRIGLPEITLGTLPGWGTCVRLPRRIGIRNALKIILQGQLLPAREALQMGLVDEVISTDGETKRILKGLSKKFPVTHPGLQSRAIKFISSFSSGTHARLQECATKAVSQSMGPLIGEICAQARQWMTPFSSAAREKIIEIMEKGSQLSLKEAFELEARAFSERTVSPECKKLIRDFFRLKKERGSG